MTRTEERREELKKAGCQQDAATAFRKLKAISAIPILYRVVIDNGRASEDLLTCCDDGLAYCFPGNGKMKEYTSNKALLTTEITDICSRHKSFAFSLYMVNPLTNGIQGGEVKLTTLNKMEAPKSFCIRFDRESRRFSYSLYSDTTGPENGEPVEMEDDVCQTKMLTDEFRNDYQPFRRRSFNYAKGLKELKTRITPVEQQQQFSKQEFTTLSQDLINTARELDEKRKKRKRTRDRVLGALGVVGLGAAAIMANPITQRAVVKAIDKYWKGGAHDPERNENT